MNEKSRSGIKESLEDCIETYFQPLIEQFQMQITRSFHSGMGALCDAVSGALTVRMVNDRGLVSFEISPADGERQFWDVELIADWVGGAPTRKLKGRKRMSLRDQARFIRTHWDDLQKRFSALRIDETQKALTKLSAQRAKSLLIR